MKTTILANLMLAPLALLAACDNIICAAILATYLAAGWYVCQHSAKVRNIFADYLKTVDAWENKLIK